MQPIWEVCGLNPIKINAELQNGISLFVKYVVNGNKQR